MAISIKDINKSDKYMKNKDSKRSGNLVLVSNQRTTEEQKYQEAKQRVLAMAAKLSW